MEDKDLSVETVTINGQKHIILRASQELQEAVALQSIRRAEDELIKAKMFGEKRIIAPTNGETNKWYYWGTAKIEDMAVYAEANNVPTLSLSDLIAQKDLLTAFADSRIGAQNLAQLWDNNISKLLGDDYPGKDPALDMAENKSSMGLAITTLQVATDNKKDVAPLHIVLNTNTNEGLIVGDTPVAPSLSAAFNKAGISYVNRNNKTAEARIEKALDKLTGNLKPEAKLFLRDAFGYRQDIALHAEKYEQPLSKLLVDKTIGPNFGKFVVKNKPAV